MSNYRGYFRAILATYYFFYFSLIAIYLIFMPKVLLELGYNAFEVGVLYAVAPFMRFLLPFIFKHLFVLTPTVYLFSLLFTFLSTLLFFITIDDFYFYLFINLIFGGAMGISLPYVETIALQKLPKHSYGKVRLWGSVGFILIALWLGKMLSSPLDILYYLSASSFFILLSGAIVAHYDTTSHSTPQEDTTFSLQTYWAFWLSIFLMQVGFGGFYNFFTIYQIDHGTSLEVASWMWSFGVICEIIMLYFQSKLLERNLLTLLQFSTLITAFRWLLLYLYPSCVTLTFISQSLHAISFALYHTTAISYVFILYTQKKLAQQFFLGIAFGLGGSVGAVLSGKIYGENLFLVEAFITLVAFLVLFIHQKRKKVMLQ